jgi:GTP cyclohydrolase II/3,4-dihydroxy 2-butanone 4-phosphate synthase/GTP cyclohydrolase II
MSSLSPQPLTRRSHVVELYSEAPLPTARGTFRVVVFRDRRNQHEHVAMVMGEVFGQEGVPVRVHSECLTSEVLGSLKCDCRQQLDRALDLVAARGRGVVLYLRQEGRGIGLGNKIKAYALQARGLDTYEANRELGFPDDLRTYDVAADMLRLIEEGIPVRGRIPSPAAHNPHNVDYLRTKRERTGHLIELFGEDAAKAG